MLKQTILSILFIACGVAYAAKDLPVFTGGWSDGTVIEWVCKPGTEGAVAFRLTLPDGVKKQGELKCGDSL